MTSSWEDRMAAAAAARALRRAADEELAQESGQEAYQVELAEQGRAEFEAGPPGGCLDCYAWSPGWDGRRHWQHVTDDDGTGLCRHRCHGGEPAPCAPVVWG
jgi:hypothetical protein